MRGFDVREFLKNRCFLDGEYLRSDSDCTYARTVEIDVDGMGPVVACPHLPEKVKAVEELKGKKYYIPKSQE